MVPTTTHVYHHTRKNTTEPLRNVHKRGGRDFTKRKHHPHCPYTHTKHQTGQGAATTTSTLCTGSGQEATRWGIIDCTTTKTTGIEAVQAGHMRGKNLV
jgi:hypothetical protein